MKRHFIYSFTILFLILSQSCAVNTTFESLKGHNIKDANVTVNAPMWLARLLVPADAKEEVTRLSKGMKKLKVLIETENDNNSFRSLFEDLSKDDSLSPYFIVKNDGQEVKLLVKEDQSHIHEILILFQSEEDTGILALSGKMKRSAFEAALKDTANKDKE